MESKKTQMRLAVLIPNYSRSPQDISMLRRAILSVRAHEPHVPILIVDDRSPYSLEPRHLPEPIPIHYRNENGGYSKAINSGLKKLRDAGFTHVLTLNSDVEVTSPFVELLSEVFLMGEIIGGRLLYPTGKIQSAGFEILDSGEPVELEKNVVFHQANLTNFPRYTMGVTGAFQAFSLSMGNYSEAYQLGFEDVEFCLRAWTQGRRVLYIPTIGGIHYESETRGKEPGRREIESTEQWVDRDVHVHDLPNIRMRIARLNQVYSS